MHFTLSRSLVSNFHIQSSQRNSFDSVVLSDRSLNLLPDLSQSAVWRLLRLPQHDQGSPRLRFTFAFSARGGVLSTPLSLGSTCVWLGMTGVGVGVGISPPIATCFGCASFSMMSATARKSVLIGLLILRIARRNRLSDRLR